MDKVVIIPVDIMYPNARVHTRVCACEQFFSKLILSAFQAIISIFQKNRAKSQTRALSIFWVKTVIFLIEMESLVSPDGFWMISLS